MDGWKNGRRWQQELLTILEEVNPNKVPAPAGKKVIYFVRHAQSQSNVAKAKMGSGGFLDTAEATATLLRVGFNAPLSCEGRRQLESVRPRAQEICGELEAVLHSPLRRAHNTALGLFGETNGDGGLRPLQNVYWRSARALKEQRPKEHMQRYMPFCRQSIIEARVKGLVHFLGKVPWSCFALVGHSNFFGRVLRQMGFKTYLCNAHVYRAELCFGQAGELVCTDYTLLAAPSTPGTSMEEDSDVEVELGNARTELSNPRMELSNPRVELSNPKVEAIEN